VDLGKIFPPSSGIFIDYDGATFDPASGQAAFFDFRIRGCATDAMLPSELVNRPSAHNWRVRPSILFEKIDNFSSGHRGPFVPKVPVNNSNHLSSREQLEQNTLGSLKAHKSLLSSCGLNI
jgi:hypothetical protein